MLQQLSRVRATSGADQIEFRLGRHDNKGEGKERENREKDERRADIIVISPLASFIISCCAAVINWLSSWRLLFDVPAVQVIWFEWLRGAIVNESFKEQKLISWADKSPVIVIVK